MPILFEELFAARRGADDLDARLLLEQAAERFPHERRVVDDRKLHPPLFTTGHGGSAPSILVDAIGKVVTEPHGMEAVRQADDRFGMAGEEKAARLEGVGKVVDCFAKRRFAGAPCVAGNPDPVLKYEPRRNERVRF